MNETLSLRNGGLEKPSASSRLLQRQPVPEDLVSYTRWLCRRVTVCCVSLLRVCFSKQRSVLKEKGMDLKNLVSGIR